MAYSNVTEEVHFHIDINEQKLTVDSNSIDNDANHDKSLDHDPQVDEIIDETVEPTPVLQCNLNDDSSTNGKKVICLLSGNLRRCFWTNCKILVHSLC